MMERDATNGQGFDLSSTLGLKVEAEDTDKSRLLFDGSSGGVSFGDGVSAEGLRIYERRKRRKMSNSVETKKVYFDDKVKDADVSAFNQDTQSLSFDAITNMSGECSLRHCSNSFSQPPNRHENGPGPYLQESVCVSVIKKALDNVKRSDNQTKSSAPDLSRAMSRRLFKQSECSTNSELCWGALSEILNSDKFSELCGLLRKNFAVVNANQVLDIDAISLKINNGDYETTPIVYLRDIQQVWTKLQKLGNDLLTIATSLSHNSRAHYEQFFRKPRASLCQGCGEKAEVRNCLVCDSCDDMYHLSCSELVGTEIPLSNWYCTSCVSNGIGSPHDKCIVCNKLQSAATTSPVNKSPTTDQSKDIPNGSDQHHVHDVIVDDENQMSNICFVCKEEVKLGDNYRTCGNLSCGHKMYHIKCLDRKQLGVSGPCWYCPSCLCRSCLVDKDDDQIVLCDVCDEAYHIYCAKPQLHSIPEGNWYCRKCDRGLKRIRTMRLVYESMQKKVKKEDASEKTEHKETMNEGEGLDMLVNAANTLSLW